MYSQRTLSAGARVARLRAHLFASAIVLALHAASLHAQQATVGGRVIDAETGDPLAGATVTIGSSQALTDEIGRFTLLVEPGRYTIIVPYVGHRTLSEPVSLAAGAQEAVELALIPDPVALDRLNVTAGRLQAPRSSLTVPAAVSVATERQISVQSSATYVEYLKEMPGVDVMQTGIMTNRVTLRGLNGIEGGADIRLLTDDRYANVPSQANRFWAIAVPPLDVDRIEVALGPSSALYGPGSSRGVIQIITKSPIDEPGTSVSLTGGNRSIFAGAFRQAARLSEKAGLKVTGQYFRGHDFEYHDPREAPDPDNPLIGARDFMAERYGGEVQLDLRPWAGSDDGVKLTYGLNMAGSAIDLVGYEAFQVKDWRYQYVQARLSHSGLFAQTFFNWSHEGDSYTLVSGNPFEERSRVFGAQAQYASSPLSTLELIGGVDFTQTIPRTGGTLHGEFEDKDNIAEIGGYLSATHHLTEAVDLVGALRADHHQHLSPGIIWSPRVGLVVEPVENQAFRATYSRAYTPPFPDVLFLDFGRNRISPPGTVPDWVGNIMSKDLGGAAVYTWNNRCPGGLNSGLCMRSPAEEGTLMPATGTVVWDGDVVPSLLSDPAVVAALVSLGLTPDDLARILANPTPTDMTSALQWLYFDESGQAHFSANEPGYAFEPIGHLRPEITSSYEVGYQGLIANRARVSVAVYQAKKSGNSGWGVATPNVFLEPISVESFVTSRLAAEGVASSDADSLAATIAATVGSWPLGTVAPDQRDDADVVSTAITTGSFEFAYWGLDLGVEVFVTPTLGLAGSYSWMSKSCFDGFGDGTCSFALNSPLHKGSLGLRFDDPASGLVLGARARYVDEFEQRSGAFNGTIESYTILDGNLAYRVPGFDGFIASLTVNNVFDNRHHEAIGAPEFGRIAMVQLQYAFGHD